MLIKNVSPKNVAKIWKMMKKNIAIFMKNVTTFLFNSYKVRSLKNIKHHI
jgi:hypothetical protein